MRHDLQQFSTKTVCLAHTGRDAVLLKAIDYTDADGVRVKAPTGMPTNGGSIPRAFWDTIGPPYASKFLPAYMIHDKLCGDANHLASADAVFGRKLRKEADKLFYEMIRFLGCNRVKAWLMYGGVRLGATTMPRR